MPLSWGWFFCIVKSIHNYRMRFSNRVCRCLTGTLKYQTLASLKQGGPSLSLLSMARFIQNLWSVFSKAFHKWIPPRYCHKLLFPLDQRVLTCKRWLFATVSFISWAFRGSSILHVLTRVAAESADNSQLCVAFIKFTFKEDSYLHWLHASASLDFLANHEMKNSGTHLPSGSRNMCVPGTVR